MKLTYYICALLLCAWMLAPVGTAQTANAPSLRGTVTDPSGALVPGAVVQLRGPGGEQRKTTGGDGQYAFPALNAGKYTVRVIAKGFSIAGRQDFEITGPAVLDAQLTIQQDTQVLNVDDAVNSVSADPESNGSALVLREKELSALSDDPDELSAQLQAMAGPGAGPNGGQIYIDGFTGGNLPNKSSIREVRINSNPFSPEEQTPIGSPWNLCWLWRHKTSKKDSVNVIRSPGWAGVSSPSSWAASRTLPMPPPSWSAFEASRGSRIRWATSKYSYPSKQASRSRTTRPFPDKHCSRTP